jgi:hypothetical protein
MPLLCSKSYQHKKLRFGCNMKGPTGIEVCYRELICYDFELFDTLNRTHPEIADFGSGQGRSDFATAGVVRLRRGLRRARTPAGTERRRLWMGTK